MKALVTGAKGMLGHDLCPVLEDSGYEVIETDINNLDITDFEAVQNFFKREKPDVIVHCAAYTNVDKAQDEIELAKKINFEGTKNIARAAQDIGATVVYISTDYVFDGKKEGEYTPADKTNPINNYGITKLEGEEAVQKHCKKHYITRTSWLYGHHGKNFVETMLSLADKPEIKVVDDQHGCPTWTVDLALAIAKILVDKMPYGIYHTCGGGKTTWYGFAKEIFKQKGLKVNLKPCESTDYKTSAERPKNSVMQNQGLLRNWKRALRDYLYLRD